MFLYIKKTNLSKLYALNHFKPHMTEFEISYNGWRARAKRGFGQGAEDTKPDTRLLYAVARFILIPSSSEE
ncbi:MAG: hypothetical protein DRM99_05705 [Thermoplasmata archaeon]|nr:MAG: hypothetical protein DRM99_05705 [Thermoplasmata archaeon]